MINIKGKKILIADDEEMIREIFRDQFEFLGATVTLAENGKIAFEKVNTQDFDVILSDVRMPGGDGFTLMKKIFPLKKPAPKLFLCSGYTDISPVDAEKFGVIEVFAKPFNLSYICAKMDEALS